MRVLVFGSSGSGKSTYARALASKNSAPHLDLDTLVWEPGLIAVPRRAAALTAALNEFLAAHSAWVIEGCNSELVQAAAESCTELVFVNPGPEASLWVAAYYERDDSGSYRSHRRLFDAHAGAKVELELPSGRAVRYDPANPRGPVDQTRRIAG